jgi:hypothetical protein
MHRLAGDDGAVSTLLRAICIKLKLPKFGNGILTLRKHFHDLYSHALVTAVLIPQGRPHS